MKNIVFSLLLLSVVLTGCNTQDSRNKSEIPEAGIQQEMLLIPGGSFLMGKKPNPDSKYVDDAIHEVWIDSFYLDKYEVTNGQYYEFCLETGHSMPEFWEMDVYKSGLKYPDHPVVGLAWAEAIQYAKWSGKRLPTEAEWEYAARGGLVQKNYPTGDVVDSSMVNYFGTYGHALKVGSFAPNAYGLYDMAGNVVEWVNDFYAKDYFLNSPAENPQGPTYGKRRVIRGGGWRSGISCNTCWFRQSLRPYWVDINVGFRCAKNIDKEN
ncbi:formylglycine-generating enzyme family protein [Bacteroidota bacterium]